MPNSQRRSSKKVKKFSEKNFFCEWATEEVAHVANNPQNTKNRVVLGLATALCLLKQFPNIMDGSYFQN